MAGQRIGRLSRRPRDAASQSAQAALDGAVSAFLDLDTRQSYVADALHAAAELATEPEPTGAGRSEVTTLDRDWAPVAQRCLDASGNYLDVSARFAPTDGLERPTHTDPVAAAAAFTKVHRELADAAAAVDTFFQRHSRVLEQARSALAAVPRLVQQARDAAGAAEQQLGRAEQAGHLYPSGLAAADQLISDVAALNAAGTPAGQRRWAGVVVEAARHLQERIAAAPSLRPAATAALASVRTRIQAVTHRLSTLPDTRSAVLREFSAACSRDLIGSDQRARQSLERAESQWSAARTALDAGAPEEATDRLTSARGLLTEAETAADAWTDRLHVLRETRADPDAAARSTRFRLRDAQLLVVNRGLVKEWGSVLDAQLARIDRARADLIGTHPDYWSYLTALGGIEAFIVGVIEKIRAESR